MNERRSKALKAVANIDVLDALLRDEEPGVVPAVREMLHTMVDGSDAWKLRMLLVPIRTIAEKEASGEGGDAPK